MTETTATSVISHDNEHHSIPELIISRVELSSSALAIVVQICVV